MKILYVTTIGSTMGFFKRLIRELLDKGIIVDIATNEEESKVPNCFREWGCAIFHISTSRSPFSFGNIKAIKQIKAIAKAYDIVHCHTPLAGMAARFGCRKLRKKNSLKVIYTAHGFHFYKGAPKKNWMIYYPIEKICSKLTDVLITINKEDYELAKKKMKAKRVEYVPGVGIDIGKFANVVVDKETKRKEIGVPLDAKVILSIGELNQNKNHQIVIKALGIINNPKIHYVIAGVGNQKENLENLAEELNVNLHLLGYRKDVAELYRIADLYVHPSLREGLPVSLMEAIASKTNVICSNIRGCNDLVKEGMFDPYNVKDVKTAIEEYISAKANFAENYVRLSKFDYTIVNEKIDELYENEMRTISIS